MKIDKTPLEKVSSEIQMWIDSTEDEMAKFPLIAALEIVNGHKKYESNLIGKVYDDGASAKYPFASGLKYFNSKFKKHETEKS
jgi:hypothetical protein